MRSQISHIYPIAIIIYPSQQEIVICLYHLRQEAVPLHRLYKCYDQAMTQQKLFLLPLVSLLDIHLFKCPEAGHLMPTSYSTGSTPFPWWFSVFVRPTEERCYWVRELWGIP